jgi:hypothetical protein
MIYGNLNKETTKKEENKKVKKESTKQLLEDCINIIDSIGTQEISDEEVEKGIYDMRHEDFNKLIQSCGLSQLIIENLGTTEPTTEEVYALLDELGITVSSDNPYHVAVPVIINEADRLIESIEDGSITDEFFNENIEAIQEDSKEKAGDYEGFLSVLFAHLLKYRFQQTVNQDRSWITTIRTNSAMLTKIKKTNTLIKLTESIPKCYKVGLAKAVKETHMDYRDFPSEVPAAWANIELLRDPEFVRVFLMRYAYSDDAIKNVEILYNTPKSWWNLEKENMKYYGI